MSESVEMPAKIRLMYYLWKKKATGELSVSWRKSWDMKTKLQY